MPNNSVTISVPVDDQGNPVRPIKPKKPHWPMTRFVVAGIIAAIATALNGIVLLGNFMDCVLSHYNTGHFRNLTTICILTPLFITSVIGLLVCLYVICRFCFRPQVDEDRTSYDKVMEKYEVELDQYNLEDEAYSRFVDGW
jgi:hypothetical protein